MTKFSKLWMKQTGLKNVWSAETRELENFAVSLWKLRTVGALQVSFSVLE